MAERGALRVFDAVDAGPELWIAILTRAAVFVFEARVKALEASKAVEADRALNPALAAFPEPVVHLGALGSRGLAFAHGRAADTALAILAVGPLPTFIATARDASDR